MNNRDLLLEFIQWLGNDRTRFEELDDSIHYGEPETAEGLVDEFLTSIGES